MLEQSSCHYRHSIDAKLNGIVLMQGQFNLESLFWLGYIIKIYSL